MDKAEQELARIKYPHMVPQEIVLWKDFLRRHGRKFTAFRYDVKVGRGVGTVPGLEEPYQRMAIELTRKRIDVVASRGRQVYIIELKEHAGVGSIGQLLSYKALYEDQHGPGRVTGLILVARSTDQDVQRVARAMRIQVILL